jgi:hypothetical protein
LFHLVAGVLGGAALIPDMQVFTNRQFVRGGFLLDWLPGAAVPAFPGLLLVIAALPAMIYQAWELAPVTRPLAWIGMTSIALFIAWPLFSLLLLVPYLTIMEAAPNLLTEWSMYAVPAFLIGALWAAPMQWLAVKRRVRFLRWWRTAGPTLGVAAIVNVLGFSWAFLDDNLAWNLAIPLAAVIYAVGTLPVISILLRPKDGPLAPAATL